MNHTFTPSLTDSKKCSTCHYDLRSHTVIAQCEACPTVGKCEIYHYPGGRIKMLLCDSCYQKEEQGQKDIADPVKQQERIDAANAIYAQRDKEHQMAQSQQGAIPIESVLKTAGDIDSSIRIVTDIFNAKTVALVDIMAAIDADDTITNKPYAKAETSVNRIKHLQTVIQAHRQQIIEWENEQKANHVYLNTLANQLRKEEREKLRLQDINYPAAPPKTVKPRSVSTTKKSSVIRWDAKATAAAATKAGTTEQVIRAFETALKMTADQAADHYLKLNKKP